MLIYLGADHGGFKLKEMIAPALKEEGYEVVDVGAASYNEQDDYPDIAAAAASKVSIAPDNSRAILICRSGAGMCMAANKFKQVRAITGVTCDQVYSCRHDDNANILCLAAQYIPEGEMLKMVQVFLSTPFSGEERYRRRLEKISQIENTA